MKVLYITAHPFTEQNSTSRRLSRKFIEEYKINNPEDEIKEIDLYSYNIDFLQDEDIEKIFNGQSNHVLAIAEEFANADKYVFASPMWNLNIPAILKAYLDYVSYVNITFKYTENGPVGLLENKKALYVLSTGGIYSEIPEFNMGKIYLESLLNFFGVKDVQTVMLEGTNYLPKDKVAENFTKVENELIEIAKNF